MINSVERGTEIEKDGQHQLQRMRQTAPSAWRSLRSGNVCKQTDALVADRDTGDERSAGHTHSVPTSSR